MMDKLELTGQTWAEFSTVEVGYVYAVHLLCSKTIQPNLKLKNCAQTTSRFYPIRYRAMRKSHFNDEFLVLLGPIISRLFTCSNEENN
jgi:hypothetical protein